MADSGSLTAAHRDALAPFVVAAQAALADWAGLDSFPCGDGTMTATAFSEGHLSATLPLRRTPPGVLAVALPRAFAAGFAERVLAESGDPALVADLVGELANVIAGHAKALLVGTPGHFDLGTPRLGAPEPGSYAVAMVRCELGELRLGLN